MGDRIVQIPRDIGALTQLRMLDLAAMGRAQAADSVVDPSEPPMPQTYSTPTALASRKTILMCTMGSSSAQVLGQLPFTDDSSPIVSIFGSNSGPRGSVASG